METDNTNKTKNSSVKKKNKKKMSDEDYYAMLNQEMDDETTEQNEPPKEEKTETKKSKKKKKEKMSAENYYAMLEQEDVEEPKEEEKPEEEEEEEKTTKKKKQQQQKKKKKKKEKMTAENYYAMLNEEMGDEMPPEESTESKPEEEVEEVIEEVKPKKQQKGKKGKKKDAKKAEKKPEKPKEEEKKEEEKKPVEEKTEEKKEESKAEEEKPSQEQKPEEKGLSKTQLRKLAAKQKQEEIKRKKEEAKKKKLEEKKKKEEEKKKKEGEKPADEKKPKKLNPKLEQLRLMQQKQKEEKERLQKLLEEEERKRKELERLAAERERQKELEKQRKKEEKKKRIEELKRKGQYLTKKEREAKARQQAAAEQFRAMGLIPAFSPNQQKKKPAKPKKEKKEETKPEEEKKIEEKKVEEKKEEEKKVEEEGGWEDLLDDEEEQKPEPQKEETKPQEEKKPEPPKEEKPAKQEEKKPEPQKEEKATKKEEKTEEKTEEQTEAGVKKLQAGELRSPICCVLGHVDTGKTSLLDRIRKTNVQHGEAGGITQQIGATYIPMEAIKRQTKPLNEKLKLKYKVPGLLIIDTPGHESFTNLRSRGSSLCDIAILVVDILHGLENQTLESLRMLKDRKCPFVVALNKVDTITEWKPVKEAPIRTSLKQQGKNTLAHFQDKVKETIVAFAEQGLNAALYYENKDFTKYISIVPTSAHTGEGIPDLLMLCVQLTQTYMSKKIRFTDELQCTILERKLITGLGHTIDVILSNGSLRESDTIVICGMNGPVVTQIRTLLTPKPLREIRVKGDFIKHKEIYAAQGVKIAAQNLETAIPGSNILVVKPGDDIEKLKEEVMKDMNILMSNISKEGRGVYVQASSLGSLEALLAFLKSEKVPVCGINVGPVHKKDVMKAAAMLDQCPEYAMILAFDVEVSAEAAEEAQKAGVKIFTAKIIYHLFDNFKAHMKKLAEEKKKAVAGEAVWPCILQIIPQNVFHVKNPIILGVDVVAGKLKLGTPLVAYWPPTPEYPKGRELMIGRVAGIQRNKQPLNEAEKGNAVAVQIDSKDITYGRHFDHTVKLYSKITRNSIDVLKENFAEELKQDDLQLIQQLKKIFDIPTPKPIPKVK